MTEVKFITENKMARDIYLYEKKSLQTKWIKALFGVEKEMFQLL